MICSVTDIIDIYRNTHLVLPNDSQIIIDDARLSIKLKKKFASFRDICRNGYHIEKNDKHDAECLYITSMFFEERKNIKTSNIQLEIILYKH